MGNRRVQVPAEPAQARGTVRPAVPPSLAVGGRGLLRAALLEGLQRTHGNQATGRYLQRMKWRKQGQDLIPLDPGWKKPPKTPIPGYHELNDGDVWDDETGKITRGGDVASSVTPDEQGAPSSKRSPKGEKASSPPRKKEKEPAPTALPKELFQPACPIFKEVDPSVKTKVAESTLVETLKADLAKQTAQRNYDRLVYVNEFLSFAEKHSKLTVPEALQQFRVDSAEKVALLGGGHCAALSADLIKGGKYGPGAYLVGSKLPQSYQQAKAPEYCHAAAIIRFEDPQNPKEEGLILLEPGFNIVEPIVLKRGKPTVLPQGEENWVFTLSPDGKEIVCQPQPAKAGEVWPAKKTAEKRMTYRTDRLVNADEAITVPLMWVDKRPQILARDEKGAVVAVIAVNYEKSKIEFRVGEERFTPVDFKDVDEGGKWLGKAAEPLAKLLHTDPGVLAQRIFQAVKLLRLRLVQ